MAEPNVIEIQLHGILAAPAKAHISAYHGSKRIGHIIAHRVLRADTCEDDVAELEDLTGRKLTTMWKIVSSDLNEELRGWGLGVIMYASIVELIGHNWPDSAVLAGACDPSAMTSALARRVWESRGLSQVVEVVGLAATTLTGPEYGHWGARLELVVELQDDPVVGLKASLMPSA